MKTFLFLCIMSILLAVIVLACCDTKPDRFDCILISYGDGQELTSWQASQRIASEFKGERVITYPDSYVPVLVPKSEVKSLKAQLKDRLLILSPHLE